MATLVEVWADNASTVLANAISASSGTLNVASGTGSKFPTVTPGTNYFRVVITSASAPNTIIEIVLVTQTAGDTFYITRAQEGTIAQEWPVGALVFNAFSAGGISNFTRINAIQNNAYFRGVDSGTANAYVVTLDYPITSSTSYQEVFFTAVNANTGASTVQIGGGPVIAIVSAGGNALQGGEIRAGSLVQLVYNGTNYTLVYATGGSSNIANATQSHHAIALGQQGTLNVLSATTSAYATNAGNSTTTSQTNFSNLTIATSQVLSAANFNNYAPTKTGTGASGTWAINISGNAATATNATTAATLNGNWTSMPSGTRTTFYQASAPPGWTQVTTVNDATVRIVSGTGGATGGTVNFSSAFASQAVSGTVTINTATGTVGTTALNATQIPAHTHPIAINDPGHNHGLNDPGHHHGAPWGESYNGPFGIYAGPGYNGANSSDWNNYLWNTSTTLTMNPQSGSFAGNSINLAVKYINMIICQKN